MMRQLFIPDRDQLRDVYKRQVEIQGRTLFEEGWSEIDHDIVYPYFKDDVMLNDFSTLLNRLSGMADEMSSYFRRMRSARAQWECQMDEDKFKAKGEETE